MGTKTMKTTAIMPEQLSSEERDGVTGKVAKRKREEERKRVGAANSVYSLNCNRIGTRY